MSIDNATPAEWDAINYASIERIASISRMAVIIKDNQDLTPDELAVLLHQNGYSKLPAGLTEQAI